jgi:hypothetical protein
MSVPPIKPYEELKRAVIPEAKRVEALFGLSASLAFNLCLPIIRYLFAFVASYSGV